MAEVAIEYAARGWRVIPLHEVKPNGFCSCLRPGLSGGGQCSEDKPDGFGKHPRTKNGLADGTTDAKIIRGWWKRWPTANVGVVTGTASGVWMLGPDGPQGLADVKRLVDENGPLPATARAKSGSGGEHYYFRWPADGPPVTQRRNHRGTRIDVRGEGGYFVAPPSRNGNGPYQWIDDTAPADAPAWLLDWARGTEPKGAPTPPPPAPAAFPTGGKPDAYQRAGKYLEKLPPAVSGEGGHDKTFAAARAAVYGFDLGPARGYDLLASEFNPRCVPPWSERELRHKCDDADAKPYDKPRGYLLNDDRGRPAGPAPAAATPIPPPAGTEQPERRWPDPLGEDAYIGPIAEYVRAIAPTTESDPAAVLVQCLLLFGSVVGRSAFASVGNTTHHLNEFAVIVGDTSAGRKGTALGDARALFSEVDDCWFRGRTGSGLSSGEGLIHFVRDPVEQRQPIKERGRTVDYETVITDHGVEDKRAFIIEPEFVNVLKQSGRESNILSGVLRLAWESGNLGTITKNSPTKATGAHVTIVGHITETELKKYLSEVETANGFGNRFLWFVCRRSKFIPEPFKPDPAATAQYRAAVCQAVGYAVTVGDMQRDDEARELWRSVYASFDDTAGGLCGAMTARAAPHVIRLSAIYAMTESSPVVQLRHLKAALAVWDYSVRSVRYLFGESTGNAVADDILALLKSCPKGVTRTDISNFFGRNLPAARLKGALNELLTAGRARVELNSETGGRPAEVWFAIAATA